MSSSQDSQDSDATSPHRSGLPFVTGRSARPASSPPRSGPPGLSPPRSSVPPATQTQGLASSHSSGSGSGVQTQTQKASSATYAAKRQAEEDRHCSGIHFYNANARRLWLAWKFGGRVKLMHEMMVIDEEDLETKGKTPVFKHALLETGKTRLLTVLFTIEDDLLEQLILSDVYRHYNTPLKREQLGVETLPGNSRTIDAASFRPLIYGNFLCNETGKTLSFNQWIKVLDAVELYKEQLTRGIPPKRPLQTPGVGAWIRSIDETVKTARPEGYNPNNADLPINSERKYIRKPYQIDRLEEWVDVIRERLQHWQSSHPLTSMDEPLPWTVIDIGWTAKQQQRRYDHEHHSGSIRIMNLVESIVKREIGGYYKIYFLSLYSVPSHKLAGTAEHILSRLCGSYAAEGGLNVTVAGKSITAAKEIKADVYTEIQLGLGAKYGARTRVTKERLKTDVNFLELATRVVKLQQVEKQLKSGKQERQNERVDVERKYLGAEQLLDHASDKILEENKAKRALTLVKDLDWLSSYCGVLETIEELSSD
ncbi:unnamed protein product [Zymoseptoria tritici ST99CH_1E4]|uniref:Uncharacterized protein n=1 Tax=Zymoseptoria tritici ST99CH_1E4 TaxID=1276532 RepID=A0A2H1H3F2_ZYMTR|nr:unnamed protein product [Zymoseptoria tritici ST99CH_1E4]